MRFVWWLLVAFLTQVDCARKRIAEKVGGPTSDEMKEIFRKFRDEEDHPIGVQVSLLVNFLEHYELFDKVDFGARDFAYKFDRVKRILLKMTLIDEGAILKELATAQPDEQSLRQKYSIPRIEQDWKHARWHDTKHRFWERLIAMLQTAVDSNDNVPHEFIEYGLWFINDFKNELQWDQGRQYVETNFPQVQQQLKKVFKQFLAILVGILNGKTKTSISPYIMKKYLKLVNLWDSTTDDHQALSDLLKDLINHPPKQSFPRTVQIPPELRIFFKKQEKMVSKDLAKEFIEEYDTVTGHWEPSSWEKSEHKLWGKSRLMVFCDIILSQGNTQARQLSREYPRVVPYVVVPAGVIATFGLGKFAYNKLAYGQFFPFWPTQVATTTLPWNTINTRVVVPTTPLVVITQEPSGWTNWQVVALVVVVAIIIAIVFSLALVYYCYFQATRTTHSSISGKDTSGTTTGSTSSTSSASSDNNK